MQSAHKTEEEEEKNNNNSCIIWISNQFDCKDTSIAPIYTPTSVTVYIDLIIIEIDLKFQSNNDRFNLGLVTL